MIYMHIYVNRDLLTVEISRVQTHVTHFSATPESPTRGEFIGGG